MAQREVLRLAAFAVELAVENAITSASNLPACLISSSANFMSFLTSRVITPARWMRSYNTVRVHGRHGLSRWAKWMQITPSQLRTVDADLARKLHERVYGVNCPDVRDHVAGLKRRRR